MECSKRIIRKKNEQIYLYRSDKTRHKAQNDWEFFLGDWKIDIYQETPGISLDFWYGTKNSTGLKETKVKEEIENKNRGQSKIMPRPIMTEEDLIRIVNKQRNGKAAGTDGIKAEVRKHLIKIVK